MNHLGLNSCNSFWVNLRLNGPRPKPKASFRNVSYFRWTPVQFIYAGIYSAWLYLGLHISPHVFARNQQNQSAFSKLLTSYRASERVTQLYHPNNSFLCDPRIKKELKCKFIWIYYGRIFIRQDTNCPTSAIACHKDLDYLKPSPCQSPTAKLCQIIIIIGTHE